MKRGPDVSLWNPNSAKKANVNTAWKRNNTAAILLPRQGLRLNSTNQQALRTGGWANPSSGGELKFKDTTVAAALAAGFATFSAANLLNGLANGSDASTRIGRKVNIKSVLIRHSFVMAPTSTGGSPIRILVVYDKQANAAAPAITDILLADDFNSPNNLSNRDRFVTIFDQITDLVSTGANFSVSDVLFKRVNFETMFNAGSAGTIGDITSGSIYLFIAQNGGITTATPSYTMRCRVRYTDI